MIKHFKLPIKPKFVPLFCTLVIVMTLILVVAAVLLGSVKINPSWIGKIIINQIAGKEIYTPEWSEGTRSIIWELRMPRVFLAFMVGAGLSLCGIMMQALTKNALADPYILGISSGASTGAVLVIVHGLFGFAGAYNVVFGATVGAVLAILMAIKVATIKGLITPTQLVLSGVAVSAIFSSITSIVIYHTKTGSDKVKSALYWMIGSLSGATWEKTIYVFILFLVCVVGVFLINRSLDALLMGDEMAITVGVDLKKIKRVIIAISTVLTGAIVSVSGVIGFVGLVIPHMTRSIVGTNHKQLIPSAIVLGGFFMIFCDIISRVIVSPEELPIGVVTAFFGAPFFLYLVRRRTKM